MPAKKDQEKEVEAAIESYITKKVKSWEKKSKVKSGSDGTAGALYFVGFVGAFIYWMQAAAGFGAVVTGFLKALVWPAYIVYKLLENFYGVVS